MINVTLNHDPFMGMSRSRVTEFIGELEKAGLVTIQRRGRQDDCRPARELDGTDCSSNND